MKIKLFSSDLNGTLVHQHTMSDMIRLYIGKQKYQEANTVFQRQTSGNASMEEAFQTAGPLTKGLTLRQAIEYTKTEMGYLDGFHEFVDTLAEHKIPLVINSTGYSVTIYAIREQIGADKIHGHIGNFLRFGVDGDPSKTLNEDELERKVKGYFNNPGSTNDLIYDQIQATGTIDLGIVDEEAKAKLIQEYARTHFEGLIKPNEIAHMGDTMGDSGGIVGVAEKGGIGIAFNYNSALENFLRRKLDAAEIKGNIVFISPKSSIPNITEVIPHLLGE